jgi:hypothetical protein
MKRKVSGLFALLFVIQASILLSQQGEKANAEFQLSLSVKGRIGSLPPTYVSLIVKYTNTSKGMIFETPCAAFGGLYRISAVLDGAPVEESEVARKERADTEAAEAKGGRCEGSNPGRQVAPGEYLENTLYYNAAKPGRYEFTVERRTFPKDPDKSVTIKSNTVTVVMPEPVTEKPN